MVEQKAGKKFKIKKNDAVEIQTWTYDSKGVAKWQQWRFVIVDKNIVMFESVNSEKAITSNAGNVNGSKLIQKKRVTDNTQKFVLVYADGPKKGQLLNVEE